MTVNCAYPDFYSLKKGDKPIVVETTGFFAFGSHMNLVMLQGYLLQEFVEYLLP